MVENKELEIEMQYRKLNLYTLMMMVIKKYKVLSSK